MTAQSLASSLARWSLAYGKAWIAILFKAAKVTARCAKTVYTLTKTLYLAVERSACEVAVSGMEILWALKMAALVLGSVGAISYFAFAYSIRSLQVVCIGLWTLAVLAAFHARKHVPDPMEGLWSAELRQRLVSATKFGIRAIGVLGTLIWWLPSLGYRPSSLFESWRHVSASSVTAEPVSGETAVAAPAPVERSERSAFTPSVSASPTATDASTVDDGASRRTDLPPKAREEGEQANTPVLPDWTVNASVKIVWSPPYGNQAQQLSDVLGRHGVTVQMEDYRSNPPYRAAGIYAPQGKLQEAKLLAKNIYDIRPLRVSVQETHDAGIDIVLNVNPIRQR